MTLNADYSAMTNAHERTLLWQVIQEQLGSLIDDGEAYVEFKEYFEDSIQATYQQDVGGSLDDLTDSLFDEMLTGCVEQLGESALNIGNVYSILRERFNNETLALWEQHYPQLAYPIAVDVIQAHPQAKSISDDDICATCQFLAYCPGEQSLCKQISHGQSADWPCRFDDEGYAEDCRQHTLVENDQDNWHIVPEEEA